jgi:ribosomal protein L34E
MRFYKNKTKTSCKITGINFECVAKGRNRQYNSVIANITQIDKARRKW